MGRAAGAGMSCAHHMLQDVPRIFFSKFTTGRKLEAGNFQQDHQHKEMQCLDTYLGSVQNSG